LILFEKSHILAPKNGHEPPDSDLSLHYQPIAPEIHLNGTDTTRLTTPDPHAAKSACRSESCRRFGLSFVNSKGLFGPTDVLANSTAHEHGGFAAQASGKDPSREPAWGEGIEDSNRRAAPTTRAARRKWYVKLRFR